MNRTSLNHPGKRFHVPGSGILVAGALICLASLGHGYSAQTNTVKPVPFNRWLFVVQASRSMQPRAEAARRLAGNLIWSGMQGQMREGDTVGLWTFNTSLYAGMFPLQDWTHRDCQVVARRVYDFLDNQKYEKGSRLKRVLPAIQQVIKDSDYLTVVLFSDGEESIKGTPFDDQINAIYRAWKDEEEEAHLPLITMLRAQNGRITHFTVTTPPWPLQLPPLPAELKAALETEKVAAKKPEKPPPPPMAPPLIIHGKNPLPGTASESTPSTVSNAVPAPAIAGEAAAGQPRQAVPAPEAATLPSAAPELQSSAGKIATAESAQAGRTEFGAAVPQAVDAPAEADGQSAEATPPSASSRQPEAGPRPPASRNTIEAAATAPLPAAPHRGAWIIGLGIAALVLGGAAVGFALLLLRRARPAPRVSLITRSLDREDKKL
jgi:hypothetical protein